MKRNSSNSHKKALKAQILAACLCVLCLGVGTAAQQADLVQLFEQVASLIQHNRLAEAEKELTSVLKVTPDLPVALNFMGTVRAKQGRFTEAEALFVRAAQQDKNFTGARMNLVYLYLLQRAPEKSAPYVQEVLALEPRQAESLLVMLGDAYLAKNDLQKAEENYLAALEGRLDNAGALFGLAQISRVKGETKEAAIYLTRVGTLTSGSKSPEFLYKFAIEALRAGLNDEAKSALERSLELKPKEPSYLLALGIAVLRKADLFEAEKIFRRVLEIQPANAQAQLHLGYVLLNHKKYDEARLWLEKSARSVAIPEVFYYLGLVAQEQNDDARAILLFEKAVQKLPSYAHARIALGSSYMKIKNYVRARQELETAVKLDPDEPTAHYNLALLYARLKDTARAQEEMRIIEKLKAKGATNSGVVVLPPKSNPR